MKIRGDWYDAGFLCDMTPHHVLIAEDERGLYDAEHGDRLTLEDDGELIGWPCFTFRPDRNDLERLRGLNDPS
jgi:hypothetical protein